MNESIRVLVTELLDKYAQMNKSQIEPYDITSLKRCMLLTELKQEIQILSNMIKTPDSFESQFKERCRWRMNNPDHTIPFSEMPNSQTNRLYWSIACILFNPQTMQDMLAIILPDLKTHVRMNLIEIESAEFKTRAERMRNLEVSLEETKLDENFTSPPSQSDLCNYLILNNTLFDVHSISLLPLKLHSSLHKVLKQKHPDLAEKLYTHNEACEELAFDIQMLNNQGITPKDAIRQLIRGLALGGSRLSGETYAKSCSNDAAKRFFEYFNGLPTETQVALREISCAYDFGTIITLGSVLYNDLGIGKCVEQTAAKLIQLLDRNSDIPFLNSPSIMTPDHLKELQNKYKTPNFLNSSKTSEPKFRLPHQLMIESIKKISPRTHEELLLILFYFPPELYEALWKNMNHLSISSDLIGLAQLIKQGLFDNPEQRQALARVIAKTYPQKSGNESITWAMATNDPIFLTEALALYSEDMKIDNVAWIIRVYPSNILGWLNTNISMFQALLESIHPSRRFSVLRSSRLIFDIVYSNPQRLKYLLELLLIPDRVGVLVMRLGVFRPTILEMVANDPANLRTLLNMLPMVDQKLEAIKASNTGKCSSLSNIKSPESLKILMELLLTQFPNLVELPENQRLPYLKTTLEPGIIVLSAFISDPQTKRPSVTLPEDKLRDSFVPDFIKIMSFLIHNRHNRVYCTLFDHLLSYNSFEDIKKHLIAFITEKISTQSGNQLLKRLHPDKKPEQSFNRLKIVCYRSTLLSYIDQQLETLPKVSVIRQELKVIKRNIQLEVMSLERLKKQVTLIKSAVDTHQNSYLSRFFKCDWSRHTTNYNQLAALFDFDQDNNYRNDIPGLKSRV